MALTWRDSEIGGEFLIYPDGLILISLSINRKTSNEGFTDVNWYLSKILPPLRKSFTIESIKFSETL